MNAFPLLITSDTWAIPPRLWDHQVEHVDDMGAYRFEVCNHCGKPVRDHIWILLAAESNVMDCSEVPR